jgi:hypothetical protein
MVLFLLMSASWLVHRFPRQGAVEAFALALTRYLRDLRWSDTSTRLFVSCLAAHAGEHDVARAALEGHLITAATMSYNDAVDKLGASLGDEGWEYVNDALGPDPRVDRRWCRDVMQTPIPFAEMIEAFEQEGRLPA